VNLSERKPKQGSKTKKRETRFRNEKRERGGLERLGGEDESMICYSIFIKNFLKKISAKND